MRGWVRVPTLCVGMVVMAGGTITGCDDACGANCGTGISVWWSPADVREAAGYRLCIDEVCEPVTPIIAGGEGQYFRVSPAAADEDRDVVVRFETLNAAGEVVQAFFGEGRKEGGCCPSVSFFVDPDGTLDVADA